MQLTAGSARESDRKHGAILSPSTYDRQIPGFQINDPQPRQAMRGVFLFMSD